MLTLASLPLPPLPLPAVTVAISVAVAVAISVAVTVAISVAAAGDVADFEGVVVDGTWAICIADGHTVGGVDGWAGLDGGGGGTGGPGCSSSYPRGCSPLAPGSCKLAVRAHRH